MNDALNDEFDETRLRLLRRPKSTIIPIEGKHPNISFEFFPPKDHSGLDRLIRTVDSLASLQPRFVSVTYGAGGSDQENSLNAVKAILSRNIPVAAHVTCVGASKNKVDKAVMQFLEAGVRHIVALRGDPPAGHTRFEPHEDGYANAADLVRGIRKLTDYRSDLSISVAAYPEKHPDSSTIQDDIENLERKFDAGADQAISQCFFEADSFLRFRDRLADAGVHAKIIPGILPVTNFSKIVSFCEKCETSVPEWMSELFADLDKSPEISEIISATVAAELCASLIDNGVNSFHFYTLNRARLTRAVCHILGLRSTNPGLSKPDAMQSVGGV